MQLGIKLRRRARNRLNRLLWISKIDKLTRRKGMKRREKPRLRLKRKRKLRKRRGKQPTLT